MSNLSQESVSVMMIVSLFGFIVECPRKKEKLCQPPEKIDNSDLIVCSNYIIATEEQQTFKLRENVTAQEKKENKMDRKVTPHATRPNNCNIQLSVILKFCFSDSC